jgi:hypothetical protein
MITVIAGITVMHGIIVMLPHHLPCLSPEMSEETRQKKLAVAKKRLREYQHRGTALVFL